MGFVVLSKAARELESACLEGIEIDAALARFDQSRRQALEELERLIGEEPRLEAERDRATAPPG
jgi:hypothetical protein